MDSQSLQEKNAFFAKLDALDNVSDNNDGVDEKERAHRDKCRAFFGSRKKPAPVQENTPSHAQPRKQTSTVPGPFAITPGPFAITPGPRRVIEATPGTRPVAANRATRLLTGTTSFIEETPVPDTARPPPASLRRSTTLPLPAPSRAVDQSPSANTAMRKRKRQPAKSVSEAPQVFRGLSFYYIPDNDIAPARKLRIARALEHGAQRVRDLMGVSHVVVDKNLQYKDIEKLFGSNITESLIIVNEDYPIDCMSFRTLLNPDQSRYRIPGQRGLAQELSSDHIAPASSQPSDHSVQLKESRTARRRDTSPQSERPPPQSDTRDVYQGTKDQSVGGTTGEPPAAKIRPPGSPIPNKSANESHDHHRRKSSTRDELSEYIELIQQYKDLPLDKEDDDLQSVKDQETVSDSEIERSSEDERARKKATAKPRRGAQKHIPFEERFACNRGGTKDKSADAQNPNARTIEILQSMCDYYTRINDNWRTMAYRKAITTLRRQTTRIMTEDEAYRLPNIGRRLAAKIEEIVSTNKLRRLEYANDEPIDQVLETFLKIYDVGTSRANKWIAQGFRTLDDLREKVDLSTNQRVGIDHYDDLNTRIPRAEVAALFAYVQRETARLDPVVELLVGGSYRRGADSSGDIDIIITKKGTCSSADLVTFLENLIANLTRKGFLVATLAALHANRQGKDGPGSKWHGCCVLPSDGGDEKTPPQIWRRLDFLLVPESEYGAALIYFTGNDIFNRSMRLLASKKGMRLNQRGLYKEVMRGKGRVKVTEGELVEGRDEKRIFELLGVKWREPWERWC